MASRPENPDRDDRPRADQDALAATSVSVGEQVAGAPALAPAPAELAATKTITSARGIPEPIAAVESAATLAASSSSGRDSGAVGIDSDETVASGPSAGGPDGVDTLAEGLEKGDRLDRFVVTGKLGEGGMGVVLAAYDPDLDRKVAIKLLRSGAWDTGIPTEGSQRLLREAQAMAKLSHPNVVVVHGVGTVDNRVYIAMEYVDGCTLAAWQKRHERSWRELVAIYCRAGRGLAAAHEAGLVHRDFKPDNVLVGNDDRVRVTDFGIVGTAGAALVASGDQGVGRASGSLSSSTPLSIPLTHVGVLLGTPIYMAPEQLERRPADARADQFSFCVALHEALYGQRPFTGKSYDELAENVSAGNFAVPSGDAGVPSWVRAILLRGLSADPDQRFPSMTALIDALEDDPITRRRRHLTIAAIAGAFVLLVGFAVVGLVRSARVVDPAERCRRDARAGLDQAWGASRRAALEQALVASGKPYAEDLFAGVAALLDQRVEAVSDMRITACEATHVRGEQSDTMLARRKLCLDRRVSEISALIEILSQRPSATAVARAGAAVEGLPAVNWCGDLDALATEVEPPATELVEPVAALAARLDRVAALAAVDDWESAGSEADSVAVAARTLGYQPLLAAALYRRGLAEDHRGATADGEATLREAVQIAAQAKDDRLVAQIWIALVAVVGSQPGHFDQAMALRTTADAAVARAGDYPIDQAGLSGVLSELWFAQGQVESAIDSARAAVGGLEKARGTDSLAVAEASLRLCEMMAQQAAVAAEATCQRALTIREARLGTHHPAVAEAAFAVARTRLAAGDRAAAITAATRARSIFAAANLGERAGEVANWLAAQ